MRDNIYSQVLAEIDEFLTQDIQVVPGYSCNQYDILKRTHLYWNSKFESGEYDDEGFKKYFYNLSKYRCQVATKAIDIDTKDIDVMAEEGQSYYPCWYFEKELRQWMKEQGFGRLINKVVYDLPIFGSVVIKRKEGDAFNMIVDLRNLFVEQSSDTLERARYVIEKHLYTPEELRKTKWQNIDEVIDGFRDAEDSGYEGEVSRESATTPFIEVYERYGEVPASWLGDGDENEYVKAVFIVANLKKGSDDKPDDGVTLYAEKIDELPYEEVHWTKTPGRWLGVGLVEDLFEAQERINEVVNLQGKGLWWGAMKIFQTRDETINRNLLSDVVNGEIVNVGSEIMPIVNEERNLGAFRDEMMKWESLANNIGFTFAPMTGQPLPAGTPLGSAVLQTQMASQFFDVKKEDVGMFLKRIILNLLIPMFQKKNGGREHILNLLGESPDELSKFDKLRENFEMNQRIFAWMLKNGDVPTQADIELMRIGVAQILKDRKNKIIKVPAGFYDDLKFKIDIKVTGEGVDVSGKMQTLQLVLQMLASNPMIFKDPQTKSILFKLLDLAGINPGDFEVAAESTDPMEEIQKVVGGAEVEKRQSMPTGGSISMPQQAEVPQMVPEVTKM